MWAFGQALQIVENVEGELPAWSSRVAKGEIILKNFFILIILSTFVAHVLIYARFTDNL